MPQAKKKEEESSVSSGLATAGRFVKSQSETKKKSDPVAAIQAFGRQELERKRKEEEEKKKKKTQVVSEPKGLLQRLYESVMGSSEK